MVNKIKQMLKEALISHLFHFMLYVQTDGFRKFSTYGITVMVVTLSKKFQDDNSLIYKTFFGLRGSSSSESSEVFISSASASGSAADLSASS